MNHGGFVLGRRDAETLALAAQDLAGRAQALVRFAEADPDLALAAGVEVSALEAKTILSSGAPGRVAGAAAGIGRTGQAVIAPADFQAIGRLEALLFSSDQRLGQRMAQLDQARASSPYENLGSMIGLATGAVGLIRSIF